MLDLAASPEGELAELRDRVLGRLLSWFSWGTLAIGALMLLQAALGGYLNLGWRTLSSVACALLVLLLPIARRRLGYRRTALLSLAYLLLVSGYLQSFRGLTAASALAQAACVLLSSLFFGKRGAAYALLACLGMLALDAVAMTLGAVQPWNPQLWDPGNPLVWLRYGAVLALFGGGLAAAFAEVIGSLHERGERLKATLARERAERAQREVQQRALERAQRFEALAQLACGMAHDFNNSLMVIMSGAELIQVDAASSPSARELASEIAEATATASAGVRRILTLGRGEAARPEPLPVADVLERIRVAVRGLLPENVLFEVDAATSSVVRMDPASLHQALLNLALNARDALARGGRLSFRAEERSCDTVPPGWDAAPGRYVVITCADTGSGMDEVVQHRIFEPFFSTKAQGRGTGLGLAMVRATVHKAGGFIELESSVGIGTTFRLYLPALERQAALATNGAACA